MATSHIAVDCKRAPSLLTLVAANIEEESERERERCRNERVNNAIISHISRRGGGAAVANEFRRRRAAPAGMLGIIRAFGRATSSTERYIAHHPTWTPTRCSGRITLTEKRSVH